VRGGLIGKELVWDMVWKKCFVVWNKNLSSNWKCYDMQMIVFLVRVAFVLQVLLFFPLASKVNFASRVFTFNTGVHYLLFLMVFMSLAFLSLYPRYIKLLATSIINNLKYIMFLMVVGLLGLEVSVRLLYPGEYPTYSHLIENKRYEVDGKASLFSQLWEKGDYFAFEGRKNLDIRILDKRYSASMSVKTNADGFRFFDKDDAGEKIMVLGDSLTFGTGVDNGKTYADQLSDLLAPEYSIHNYGIGGWAFAEYYLAYKKLSKKHVFPLVIIGVFPGNDFAELNNSSWSGKENGALPVPPLVREDIIVGEKGAYGGSPLYSTPVLREIAVFAFVEKIVAAPFRRYLKAIKEDYFNRFSTEDMSVKIIADISKDSNLLVLLLPPEYHYPAIYSPDSYVKKLKSIDGVNVLNFYPIFADKYEGLYVDKSHFNAKGNSLVAQEVFKFIKSKGLL